MSSLDTDKPAALSSRGSDRAAFSSTFRGSNPSAPRYSVSIAWKSTLAIWPPTRPARDVVGRPLLQQFVRNRRSLLRAYRQISAAYRRKETFGPDAEWLLDNFHIVSEAISMRCIPICRAAIIRSSRKSPPDLYAACPRLRGRRRNGGPRRQQPG